MDISQNFVAFLEYMNFNNWNWSLEKKCIEMRVFFAKRRKKVILFISVWPVYTYWEKIAKEKSLFMYNRLKFAAKEANLCIHKSKHQKKGENLPAARPKARYFVPKIIMINCEKDLFLWSKKKRLKVAWNLFEIPRMIYLNSTVKGFLIQNSIYLFNVAGCVSDLIHSGLELGIWNWGCHLLHRISSAGAS